MKRILVCGAGGAPATNFVRSLRLAREPFFLAGTDCDSYTLCRAETDVKLLVPKAGGAQYLAVVNQIIDEHRIEFVHIQNDSEIGYLSEQRDALRARLNLPSKETVAVCLDKFASYERWREAGLTVPKTKHISSESDLAEAFDSFGPKLWIRNARGAAGRGALPVAGVQEAVAWINFQKGWGNFVAAERLTDSSVTWMSLWDRGEIVVAQGRKRLYWEFANRAPSGVTGITGAGVTYADPALDEIALAAIRAIDPKPNGIFSVDLTYDVDGVPNPTEINIGRFFTTHLFFSQAGLNMPELFIKLSYGEKLPELAKKINPLKPGLVWVRGVDVEPVLTDVEAIAKHQEELENRLARL